MGGFPNLRTQQPSGSLDGKSFWYEIAKNEPKYAYNSRVGRDPLGMDL
jgi:hypothetical protein